MPGSVESFITVMGTLTCGVTERATWPVMSISEIPGGTHDRPITALHDQPPIIGSKR
jgi:hypothetical protein